MLAAFHGRAAWMRSLIFGLLLVRASLSSVTLESEPTLLELSSLPHIDDARGPPALEHLVGRKSKRVADEKVSVSKMLKEAVFAGGIDASAAISLEPVDNAAPDVLESALSPAALSSASSTQSAKQKMDVSSPSTALPSEPPIAYSTPEQHPMPENGSLVLSRPLAPKTRRATPANALQDVFSIANDAAAQTKPVKEPWGSASAELRTPSRLDNTGVASSAPQSEADKVHSIDNFVGGIRPEKRAAGSAMEGEQRKSVAVSGLGLQNGQSQKRSVIQEEQVCYTKGPLLGPLSLARTFQPSR